MKKFQRTIENFNCEHCSASVSGDGYTNHCPKCLYSKHVDINPGDRANTCGGLMAPIAIQKNKKGDWTVLHKCQTCGTEKPNKTNTTDNYQQILEIARKNVPLS